MEAFRLHNLPTFGDVAAEGDAVLDYFLPTSAVRQIDENRAFLVLGRKGTGKTAIVRYFTESHRGSLSKSLNLRGYPWNVHAQRLDHGASSIEAYVSSWRYLIAVELSSMILADRRADLTDGRKELAAFISDNYGGVSPKLSDILRPQRLRLGKFSFAPQVMGNQLGSIELDRAGKDHQFGLELNALSSSIMTAVSDVVKVARLGSLNLHFDELDQGLSTLDENRARMLIGLVIAAREIKRESKGVGCEVNPLVYLRTDIWDEMQFSDKNKITQSQTIHLTWSSDALRSLIDARISAKLGQGASWDAVTEPNLMRGSQTKWKHVLARTFSRPRDFIQFSNIALGQAKKRTEGPDKIINEDIVNSREEYSSYLKSELDDEIRPHWPHWEEALQACSGLSTITFDRGDFESEYDRRKSAKNFFTAEDALRMLYRFSVIGYERRSGYGGTSWAFQYTDPEAGWDNGATKLKVHLGLKEYAKLIEARQ